MVKTDQAQSPTRWGIIKQALMTGVTGVVCFYLADWMKLPQAVWAVMSAMIVIQSDIEATITASQNRVAGTFIGAVMGGLFLFFLGNHPWTFGIAVTVVIFLCLTFKLLESYRIAGVTVAIVILTSQSGAPWIVAMHRFLEVTLGIVIALIMTLLVYPTRVYHILRTKFQNH